LVFLGEKKKKEGGGKRGRKKSGGEVVIGEGIRYQRCQELSACRSCRSFEKKRRRKKEKKEGTKKEFDPACSISTTGLPNRPL